MGLSNKQSNRQTFVTVVGGRFTIRLQDGDDNPEAVERTLEKGPNKGKVVKELQFTHLDGMIVGAEMDTESQYPSFNLLMEDDGESFKLQLPLESQYFGQVAKRLAGIDCDEIVVFGIGFDKEANHGKGKHFLFIQQDGESIHMLYTKDNPNGMPPPVEKTVKGQKKWDFSEQENFLYEVAVAWLANKDGDPKTREEAETSVPF
jgi:hypothetical protein